MRRKNIFIALILIGCSCFAVSFTCPARAAGLPAKDMHFLQQLTADVLEQSRVRIGQGIDGFGKNTTGGTLIRPGGRSCYPAFWIRDYAMSLECGMISQQEQKHALLLTAAKQQNNDWHTPTGSLVPRGAIPDHINLDGSPIFFPGTYDFNAQGGPSWGKLPSLDDHFFFIHMAWYYVAACQDTAILESEINGQKLIEKLDLAFQVPPSDPKTDLVLVSKENRGVSFGFMDSVEHTGNLLFCSLLKWRAARELAELHMKLGQEDKKKYYDQIASTIKKNIPIVFPSSRGLLTASSGKSSQPCVWGSAFAVYIDALEPDQANEVGQALARAYRQGTLSYLGNIRHIRTDDDFSEKTAWENTVINVAKNRYQNGAYWNTSTGWVCYAIAQVDKPLALKLAQEYISELREGDFRKGEKYGSPWECIHPNGNYKQNAVYLTSVTCPLTAFRKLHW